MAHSWVRSSTITRKDLKRMGSETYLDNYKLQNATHCLWRCNNCDMPVLWASLPPIDLKIRMPHGSVHVDMTCEETVAYWPMVE